MSTTIDALMQIAAERPLYTLIGPPGTGKTTTLAAKVEDAVAAGWQVLIASLTKTAAREVAGRRLPLHESRIGTLHSHAFRALGGHVAIAEGKEGLSSWAAHVEDRGLPPEWTLSGGRAPSPDEPKDAEIGGDGDERTKGDDLLEEVGVLRSRLAPFEVWPVSARAFFTAWCDWKREQGFLDFEDLIERCATENVPPAMDVDALYADEVQDFSASEWRLLLAWSRYVRALVVVGDPRQCLYEWRGSSPALFGELVHASKKVEVLRQSYRVPKTVHAEATAWVEQLQDGLDAEYLPVDRTGDVSRANLSLRRAEFVVEDVEDDLAAGRDVMLLTACSYMLRPVLAVLRNRGVPFSNKYRPARGDWNPLGRASSPTSSAGRIVGFSRVNADVWGAEHDFWTPKELLGWTDPLPADLFVRGAKAAIKRAASADGRPLSLEDFAALVPSDEALAAMLHGDLAWYRGHLRPVFRTSMAFAFEVAERRGLPALTTPPRVTVGTMHSVKGGEGTRVYLWPDLSPSGFATWCNSETRGQVIRQVYVGMTRAKQSLVLCGASSPRSVTW